MSAAVSDESFARCIEFPDTDDELAYPSFGDGSTKTESTGVEGDDRAAAAIAHFRDDPGRLQVVGHVQNVEDEVSYACSNDSRTSSNGKVCYRQAHLKNDLTHLPMRASLDSVHEGEISLAPSDLAGLGKNLGNSATVNSPEDNGDESADDSDDEICSICLEAYVPGERASLLLECEHMFHKDCLKEWWRRSPNCPNCREPMVWPCVSMVI